MLVIKNGPILDVELAIENVHSQILEVINHVYVQSQNRYSKLSKKSRKVIDELHDEDFENISDTSDYYVIEDIEDYTIEPFNTLLEDLKDKERKYIVGKAESIYSTIKMLDLQINTRAYNLLRFLMKS